jgi:hypothetical protein
VLRRPAVVLSATALGALLLSGCVNEFEDAAEPTASLPPAVSELVGTDVGQFFVQPRQDLDKQTLETTVAKLKQMPGVQTAKLEQDGRLNLELRPGASKQQRADALQQAAGLGPIEEGV